MYEVVLLKLLVGHVVWEEAHDTFYVWLLAK